MTRKRLMDLYGMSFVPSTRVSGVFERPVQAGKAGLFLIVKINDD